MKTKHVTWIRQMAAAAAIPLLVAGCATSQPNLSLSTTAGPPETTGRDSVATSNNGKQEGGLMVYTAIRPSRFVEASPFFSHRTHYTICDASGKAVREVPSSLDVMEPSPRLVELPAGNYVVKARSATYGLVSIPVLVKPNQTTPVYLDGSYRVPDVDPAKALKLPDGEVAGWKASL